MVRIHSPDQIPLENQLLENPDYRAERLDKQRCPFLALFVQRRWLSRNIGVCDSPVGSRFELRARFFVPSESRL